MNRKRLFKWFGMLLAVLSISSCSKEEGDYYDLNHEQFCNMSDYGFYSNIEKNGLAEEYLYYHGVWSVDGISADTANVQVYISKDSYVTFSGFPYQAMIDKLFPGQKIKRIKSPIQEKLPLRIIGYSDKIAYFEFVPIYTQSIDSRSIYFIVLLEDGREVGISVLFVPDKSNATLNVIADTFNGVLSADIIVGSEWSGGEQVINEKKFDPEIKLRYTSIKRMEKGTGGN